MYSWARTGLQAQPNGRRRQVKTEEVEESVKAPRT